jgi:hypothetical protein
MSGQEAHPAADVLAEFRAGLVEGPDGRRVAGHVSTCPECAATCARLDELGSLLAAVPEPAMPDQVTRQLTSVISAEAVARATAVSPGPAVHRRDAGRHGARRRSVGHRSVGHRGAGRRGFTRPAMLLPMAAAACLLVAGGIVLTLPGHKAPLNAASGAASSSRSHTKVPNGSDHISTISPGYSGLAAPKFTVWSSGTDYRAATLAIQVAAEVAVAHPGSRPPSGGMVACVHLVTPDHDPVFVNTARYQGAPAIVIATSQTAWVVGTGCNGSHEDLIKQVRLP